MLLYLYTLFLHGCDRCDHNRDGHLERLPCEYCVILYCVHCVVCFGLSISLTGDHRHVGVCSYNIWAHRHRTIALTEYAQRCNVGNPRRGDQKTTLYANARHQELGAVHLQHIFFTPLEHCGRFMRCGAVGNQHINWERGFKPAYVAVLAIVRIHH